MAKRSCISILHIVSGDLWAGAEAMAFELLSGLNGLDGLEIHLIVLNKGRLERLCRQVGIKCYLIDESKSSAISIAMKTVRLSCRIRPHIIHAHRYKEDILAAISAGLCATPKLVATQHGRVEDDTVSLKKLAIEKLNHLCLRFIYAATIAVSNDTAHYLVRSCRIRQEKISVIPNGVGIPIELKRKDVKATGGPVTIGSAGRLFPVKRFDIFLEIASKVCQANKWARFLIAGEGPERKNLEALIARFGLVGRVVLRGQVHDMIGFYSELDVYINTSAHEGTPMSVLEAMGNGLPIISFCVAGLKELISDGKDGFVVPEGDVAHFAAKIIELIHHPERITVLGNCARRKIVDCYSRTKMVERYRTLYQQILST